MKDEKRTMECLETECDRTRIQKSLLNFIEKIISKPVSCVKA